MKDLREAIVTINLDSSKAEVWDLLFNRFGEVNIFNPIIDGSHHRSGTKGEVGCERRCDIDANNFVHKKITGRKGTDSFDIEVIEGGLPMMGDMLATLNLKEITPNQTNISLTMKFNTSPAFVGALMKPMMKAMLFKMMIGLKYYLETGHAVTKENIKGIIRAHKRLSADESFAPNAKLEFAA
ncbi:MAG: hypothetical protein HRT71_05305 [Flavobacteriales bacterium]|nr:hypothetical protein [Flavobacteriales bacterium]